MAAHNIPVKLQDKNAVFPISGKAMFVDGNGFMLAWGTGIPAAGIAGYGKGCIYQNTSLTGVGDCLYINIGSSVAANWKVVTVTA